MRTAKSPWQSPTFLTCLVPGQGCPQAYCAGKPSPYAPCFTFCGPCSGSWAAPLPGFCRCPSTTQSQGTLRTTWTGMPVSWATSLSRPRSKAPPPVSIMPPVDDVRRQLRRGLFQGVLNGVHHNHHAVGQSLPDLVGVDSHVLGQAVHQVAALDFHKGVDGLLGGEGGANADFNLLGGALANEQVVLLLHVGDNGLVELVAGHAHGNRGDNVPPGR